MKKIKSSKPHFKPLKGKRSRPDAERKILDNMDLKARFWLEKRGQVYLAQGRVTLLEKIKEYGSLTKAAKSMNMSYRHAWLLLDSMNALAKMPLVSTAVGGKGGGGAYITPEGNRMIAVFYSIRDDMKGFLRDKGKKTQGKT